MPALKELIAQLQAQHPRAAVWFSALRVPDGCYRLAAVLEACDEALTAICDYHDASPLIEVRALVRACLKLLRIYPTLSNETYPDLERFPPEIKVDPVYVAFPLRQMPETWWQEALREALLVQLILAPNPSALKVLSTALRHGVQCALHLPQPQKSPLIRMTLLARVLEATNADRQTAAALRDACKLITALKVVREEIIHPDGALEIDRLSNMQAQAAALPSRIRLARLARDIGVQAVAQRRIYHTPIEALIPDDDSIDGLVERANRWDKHVKTALMSCLLLGRIGRHVLQTENTDPYCRLVKAADGEVWVERVLLPQEGFRRHPGGDGYCPVSSKLPIPLPRVLGNALFDLCFMNLGAFALKELNRCVREYSRDSGQALTVGRLTNKVEVQLEGAVPDTALLTLLGMRPDAGRDAAIHYFSPAISRLNECFTHAVDVLAERWCVNLLEGGWSVPSELSQAYFGYSYRADKATLRELIGYLRRKGRLPRGRSSKADTITAFNYRVAHFTLMYLASTGARPTGNVLPSPSECSFDEKAAITSEKDSLGYRSTRLVPLVARLCVEFESLQTWCSNKRLSTRSSAGRGPILMLQNDDNEFVPPTLENMRRLLPGFAEYWLWPNDVFRHLFRSCMWEVGCPTAWLRRVMAHHPKHASSDLPYVVAPLWHGLHDHDQLIDQHLDELGF